MMQDPRARRKMLEVQCWDPGEGMESIQIIDPVGNEVAFEWTATLDQR